MNLAADMTGRVLAGRYRVDGRIGRGGFAVVYRGIHLELGSPVAIKIITRPSAELLARFRREARVQDRLHSRFIVRLRDFGSDGGLPFIVQDFVEGRNLRDVVEFDGPMIPRRAAEITRQICLALDEAHHNGIIHRDIKPANVMLVETSRGEEIRLLDFGIAKAVDDASREVALTRTGQVFGTVAYMAPEQLRAQKPTPQTDLYAIGGLFYTLLTGSHPYQGTIEAVAMQHLVGPLPRLPRESPTVLEAVIQRAMAKEPSDRYRSAAAMARAIETLADQIGSWSPLPNDEATDVVARDRSEVLDSALFEAMLVSGSRQRSSSGELRGELVARDKRLLGIPITRRLVAATAGAATMGVLIAVAIVKAPTSDRADDKPTVVPVPPVLERDQPSPARKPERVIVHPIEVPRRQASSSRPALDDLLERARRAHRAADYEAAGALYDEWLRQGISDPRYDEVRSLRRATTERRPPR
ncbi:MAG: serine/threonine protein kinase [Myxococcales bacterium]|nr:serine/threonine protein kinase [Myxococcales bacterium]